MKQQETMKVGDRLTWKTINGTRSGEIVRVEGKFYYVRIDGSNSVIPVHCPTRHIETR